VFLDFGVGEGGGEDGGFVGARGDCYAAAEFSGGVDLVGGGARIHQSESDQCQFMIYLRHCPATSSIQSTNVGAPGMR
jgi:hypothetical protein